MIGDGLPLYKPLTRKGCSFSDFTTDCEQFLKHYPIDLAATFMVMALPMILMNVGVTTDIIPFVPGRHVAYEPEPGGLTVLAHYHPRSVRSRPHNHGRTWAIYGVVTGRTAMNEWEIVEPSKKGVKGTVKLTRSYWIECGQAYYYPQGAIHSHWTEPESRLIRLEGINLKRRDLKLGGRSYEIAE
jgi:hypothetical protein